MTPAVQALRRAGVAFEILEYAHDPAAPAYGEEAARALGLPSHSVFKTLLADIDGQRPVIALVPVSASLDLKTLARAAGAKRATMAEPDVAERATGYVVGGISPLGQKQRLATFIDPVPGGSSACMSARGAAAWNSRSPPPTCNA